MDLFQYVAWTYRGNIPSGLLFYSKANNKCLFKSTDNISNKNINK